MGSSPGSKAFASYLLAGDHTPMGSKPPLPPTSPVGMAGGGIGSGPGSPSGEKVPATVAGYQDTADTCAGCDHFIADGQPCQVVSDPVQSSGWCKLFSGGDSAKQPGEESAHEEPDGDEDDEDNSGPTVDPDQQDPGPATSIPDEEEES